MSHTIESMGFTNNIKLRKDLYKRALEKSTTKVVRENTFFKLVLDKKTNEYLLVNLRNIHETVTLRNEFVKESEMLIDNNNHFNNICKYCFTN